MQQALSGNDGVALVAILPASQPELPRLRKALGTSALLLADPAWSTYPAYGLHRGSFREIWLSPGTWLAYARLLARGGRLRRPEQDTRWLGGDALIDARGILRWLYASRHPADRPSAGEVQRQLERASSTR